ncbi:GNAT family N-acetyltransferase [Nesterenkonia sandarakina]|uniref:Ribosomal protein S18 acetylase RimI-like enzyme n=1 Tax=Nesterenkonia sandarakina TaxID=272918 RepID=A0A2T0YQ80_9MICC|nr:GNAT family N-acetyltransferase [Nesterenkonia sandarakina]PRZ17567.1 ribosomal protein S18 acetylase RimI-like enzyme [Nesterenkonia sandarakina]
MTDRPVPGASYPAIREPRLEDADRIAAVHVATWQETYTDLLPEGFFTEDHARMRREMWTRILTAPREEWTIRVAESDGAIIGFAMAGPVQEAAAPAAPVDSAPPAPPARELSTLYVLRSHHGTGAGQALLDATIGAVAPPAPGSPPAPAPAPAPVSLWVAEQNPRALAFYRRNGFRRDGAEKQDPGAPAITDVRMVRP